MISPTTALGVVRFLIWTKMRRIRADGLGRLDGFPRVHRTVRTEIRVGARVRLFPGVRLSLTRPGASVRIGARTYFNRNVEINCSTSVEVGSDCAIAWDVLIMDNDAHSVNGVYGRAPIRVGDHVWIGQGARILKGVTIGDGAIVGTGSIVTRDVPPRALVVGSPARVISTDVTWEL